MNFEELMQWLQSTALEFGLKLIAALAIFIIGRWVARALSNGIKKLLAQHEVDDTLETFVGNLSYMVLLAVVILAAISQLGVQTASIIAMFGAAGLAIGLALQGSLSNFAAGILIIFFKPYKVGDYIQAAGVEGTVDSVQIFTTVLTTVDNKQVIVPNSKVTDAVITNYSANDTRRSDIVVGVSYDDDIDRVKQVLKEIIDSESRVLAEPPAVIAVQDLADSSVNFVIRVWVNRAELFDVTADLKAAIKEGLTQAGISIPYPHRTVLLEKNDN